MRNLRMISWKLVALFVLGAIGSGFYVTRLRAFTLIETLYLPAVQLVAAQEAEIRATNFSSSSIEVVITTYRQNGTMLHQKTFASVAPFATATLLVKAGATGTESFSAAISLSDSTAAVAHILLFDNATGEANAILPFTPLP